MHIRGTKFVNITAEIYAESETTVILIILLSPAAPKARDGRYCNAVRHV